MQLDEFKSAMKNEFEMTDLGLMRYFLGIEVKKTQDGMFMSQQKYATEIFKKFKMDRCKPVDTPIEVGTQLSKDDVDTIVNATLYRQLAGSIMYLTTTRPV